MCKERERDEYIFKCARRFQECFSEMTASEAIQHANLSYEACLQRGDELDDPEGDADEEMSIWAQEA